MDNVQFHSRCVTRNGFSRFSKTRGFLIAVMTEHINLIHPLNLDSEVKQQRIHSTSSFHKGTVQKIQTFTKNFIHLYLNKPSKHTVSTMFNKINVLYRKRKKSESRNIERISFRRGSQVEVV